MSTPLGNNDLILFTGDSITDCRRERSIPDSLGMGYVSMICGRLGLEHPELNLRFRNTGISGDRTGDLLARWNKDCITLEPSWVSILIGINNTLRRYDNEDPTPEKRFEIECRELLQQVKDRIGARLILCSPFLLPVREEMARMREDLDPKIAILRALADAFDAIWVDFDAAFVSAQQRHIPSYWAEDGVHPSIAGHALLAETWLGVVGS